MFTISESWMNSSIFDEAMKIHSYNTIRQDSGYKLNKNNRKKM